MIEAGCLLVDTLRCSKTSFSGVKFRSFWLLKREAAVKVFSSKKMRIRFSWLFKSFNNRVLPLLQALLNPCCTQQEFPGSSQTFWSNFLNQPIYSAWNFLLLYSLIIFWHGSFSKTFLMAYNVRSSWSRTLLYELWDLQTMFHPMKSHSVDVQLIESSVFLKSTRSKVNI